MNDEQLFSVKIDSATYGRVRRLAKREGRTHQTIMHRAMRLYDDAARREEAARRRGET